MPANTIAHTLFDARRHAISHERPRLLGSRQDLQALAQRRPEAYQRMIEFARRPLAGPIGHEAPYDLQAVMYGLSIAYVLEGNREEGRIAIDHAFRHFIDKPILVGHETFGHDMARCAIVYDLCHDLWSAEEKKRFMEYVHATIDANVESETSVFHNGWAGYKNWGYGLAAYALMHDDPRAPEILRTLEKDYLDRAGPGFELAGKGGGWAEGYYIHYFLMEWMFFCEVARTVEGLDYYSVAPGFFNERAVAAMFEFYPPLTAPTTFTSTGSMPSVIATEFSRRPIPMGDGMGRWAKHERDKTLATRRILVNLHREDPVHQAVHAFNMTTPKVAIPCDAYMDFLWNDTTVKPGDLANFKLSHFSSGPGYVYARSSWKDDAAFLFFKSGPRFTSHQHLDNGHFLLFKNAELLGDGGHYDSWTGDHVVNYYIRSIAHNTILIHDPSEKFTNVRGTQAANDGGQAWHWTDPAFGSNGYSMDPDHWHKHRDLLDIGRITAYTDRGDYLYTAGDYTRSYSSRKARSVTRQIVFLRPGTFIIFDRVESTDPSFRKSFLLQPMKVPEKRGPHYVVTNGNGRLFIQTLSPVDPVVTLYHGDSLYTYGGQNHPNKGDLNCAPECRMEISPKTAAASDYFVHVLTATDASVESVALATFSSNDEDISVTIAGTTIRFQRDRMEAVIVQNGKEDRLTNNA